MKEVEFPILGTANFDLFYKKRIVSSAMVEEEMRKLGLEMLSSKY